MKALRKGININILCTFLLIWLLSACQTAKPAFNYFTNSNSTKYDHLAEANLSDSITVNTDNVVLDISYQKSKTFVKSKAVKGLTIKNFINQHKLVEATDTVKQQNIKNEKPKNLPASELGILFAKIAVFTSFAGLIFCLLLSPYFIFLIGAAWVLALIGFFLGLALLLIKFVSPIKKVNTGSLIRVVFFNLLVIILSSLLFIICAFSYVHHM